MIVILLPRFWYSALTLGPIVLVRERDYSLTLLNHERIHVKQQMEMLWVFAYLLYWVEFIVKLMYYRNVKKAYEAISFEREARYFQRFLGYAQNRKPYTFVKYIFSPGKKMLTISYNSDQDTFDEFYASTAGTVFRYNERFDSLLKKIEADTPEGKAFKVKPITPGTNMFTIYGAGHAVVTENTL